MGVSASPHLAAESAAAVATTGGIFSEWAGLMLIGPILAFLVIVLFGKRMRHQGAEVAIGAMAFNLVWSSALLLLNMGDSGVLYERSLEIASVGGGLVFELGWIVDGLSIMMYWVVAAVGLAVFIYAHGYMKGEVRVTFFFAALSLFAGSMLVLVGSPNLVQLIIGWEGVGLASYLLIGHHWELKENSSAAMKAFYTNKVADVGLVIGVIIIGITLGSFHFWDLASAAAEHSAALGPVAVAAGLLLFFGAMGKSAQFPLHIWLPDAMAGPTPVSALMHAATMVTAGIYLMARTFPLYQELATAARPWMIAAGTVTLFGMGLLALVADDIKRVLAYSTVSQLGYMMTAVAAGGYTAGLFHLFTHAFFKALLFLGAGSVIHAVHSNNMSDMGGLRRHMPDTYRTFVMGALALAGVFPLSGFWSKDEILATLGYEGYTVVMWIAVAGAFVTAFYMARAVALTFFGEFRGHGEPHESPPIMTRPLWALAVPAVLAGVVNIPGLKLPWIGNFTSWLSVRSVPMGDHHAEAIDLGLAAAGLAAAVAGLWLGWVAFGPPAADRTDRDRVEVPVLYPLLRQKYYLDHAALGLVWVIRQPAARAVNWVNDYVIDGVVNGVGALCQRLAGLLYGGVDQHGIDGVVHGLSWGASGMGGMIRRIQSGRVQQYAGLLVAGLLLLAVVVLFVL
ncbi:MAG: NADH-quinone oxidoreductase subunit L [bacterium]|nr:NADH-quinone oxidoreductase subunit L [bacterium]